MCPACITTLALAVAGTGSAGGLTALVVSKLHRRHRKPGREPASAQRAESAALTSCTSPTHFAGSASHAGDAP